MRPPTDFELLTAIYDRHRGEYESALARDARLNEIFVPIDIPAIADKLGIDQYTVFGRLYYHLDPKYAPPVEPGQPAALPTLRPSIRLDSRPCGNHRVGMDIVAAVVIVLFVVVTGVVVIGVFIWAAVKDGQEDKALQARLRIRRRTRLGR
jgi:hypothetical protein